MSDEEEQVGHANIHPMVLDERFSVLGTHSVQHLLPRRSMARRIQHMAPAPQWEVSSATHLDRQSHCSAHATLQTLKLDLDGLRRHPPTGPPLSLSADSLGDPNLPNLSDYAPLLRPNVSLAAMSTHGCPSNVKRSSVHL